MKKNICILLLILLYSCNNKLDRALDFAEKNRGELQKVLSHYKNDNKKLKAAIFLIENMPQHYSLEIPNYDRWKELKVKSVLDSEHFSKQDSLEIESLFQKCLYMNKVYDSKVITADFLIQNIDFSFKIWENSNWSHAYTFEEFCQSILPYRIGHEPLQLWKKQYYQEFSPLVDSLKDEKDVIKWCDALVRHFSLIGFPNNELIKKEPPVYDALFLKKHKIGGCKESSSFFAYVMRSLGIPVNIDILFYSNQLKQAHYWNSVKDSTGTTVPFWLEKKAHDVHVERGLNDDDVRPKWKIYRNSYKIQEKIYLKGLKDHYLSKILNNCTLEDVTKDYYGENKLDVETNVRDTLVFLTRHYLLPIDAAPVRHGKATFTNIGSNMVYFLYYYSGSNLIAANYPFYFDGKEINYLIPDEKNIQKIKLTRKRSISNRIKKHLDNALGIRFEAIDNEGSTNELLHEITDTIRTNYNLYKVDRHRKTRYVNCTSSSDKYLEIADLTFYKDTLKKEPIPYIITNKTDTSQISKICDNDPLSYYTNEKKGDSIIIKFEYNAMIKYIQFVPRNDDNFIRIGDEYELFYHIGKGWGWKSLGKQKAKTNYLYYNVPQNALFWLKNLTRGSEEQLFIYDNKQIFLR